MQTPETSRNWLDPHELGGFSSVRLFVESASLSHPGFELTHENMAQVARICQLMQGMPLGLELAAAWAVLSGYALLVRVSTERYEIHELFRQYAEEALRQEPESWMAVRDLHSSYYLRFLCERGKEMGGPGHRAALEAIDAEVENIRQAWTWAIEVGQFDLLDNALLGFYTYHNARGQYRELYRQLSLAVESLISSKA